MFSIKEKQYIAQVIERTLLELQHPEMPTSKPVFKLRVEEKEAWSWAEIEPNWKYGVDNPPKVNSWNEVARDIMEKSQ